MNIDPIVLLAYVSVSINVITMIAACIAYAIFHVRKHRRKKTGSAIPDQPAGLPFYAALNFVLVDRRVRFEASVRAAERAHLKLSARLLEVAERVVLP